MKRLVVLSLVALFALPSFATEVPSAEEVRKVMNHYRQGQGKGPVLIELVSCLKIDRPAEGKKKECVEPVTGAVKKGTKVSGFSRWFVPEGDSYELAFEWLHDGKVVNMSTGTVEGSFNYGTWKTKTLTRPGTWELRIKRGDEVVGTTKFEVE